MMNAGESVPNAFLMREKCVDENSEKAAMTNSLFSQTRLYADADRRAHTYTHVRPHAHANAQCYIVVEGSVFVLCRLTN